MDAKGRVAVCRDNRGMALVWVALLLVVFCSFLALAIDIGYMYVARGELQNAADAAALAGAAKLVEGTLLQPEARAEALRYAAENAATKKSVTLASDGSNELKAENDIVVGNWTQSRNPTFLAGGTPVNAVQVRARRTAASDPGGASPDGAVELFFAKVLGGNWDHMAVSASAIAQRPLQAGFYIMVGRNTCDTACPITLTPKAGNMAWTSLLNKASGASEIKESLICSTDQLRDVQVCGQNVYTTNGIASDIFKAVELDFYDPNYDRGNKHYNPDGSVANWTIVVPVSSVADPSKQPSPQPVWGYAKVVISRACGAGGGNACAGRVTYTSPGFCSGGEDDIVISSISCVSCDDRDEILGVRPSLVQ
jgi:Flp pilus assembly protein TadG